jgi:putative membrane protein
VPEWRAHNGKSGAHGKMTLKRYILPVSLGILAIIYSVGVWGMMGDQQADFVALTPVNLLITSFLLIMNLPSIETRYWLFPVIAWLTGFGIEVAGVHTGVIFGSYTYGDALGPKLFDVPLMIGVNWALVVYSAATVTGRMKTSVAAKAFFTAVLLTTLDAVMEPVAMKLGFWQWKNDSVPVRNYVAWFVVSYFLSWVFFRMHNDHTNKLGPWVFFVQLVFFTILAVTLP